MRLMLPLLSLVWTVGQAQTVEPGIPAWADSALVAAGLGSRFDLTSSVGPTVGWGDFDGDGLLDVAVGIVDQGGRRRGIAIVHRIDESVHIVGAGQPVGDGTDDLARETTWSVARLRSHRDGIRVVTAWHGSGWLVWDGRSYAWLADSR